MKLKTLTKAETEIMMKIWELNKPVSSAMIMEEFSETKKWKSQTICTFLARLVNKRFLSVEKKGNSNLYIPIVSKNDFEQSNAEQFFLNFYNGSAKNMISSLIECGTISKKELEELKEWLDGM